MPTEPVIWASGVKIPDLEESINSYLEELSSFLQNNFLLISAPKSAVTLFTLNPRVNVADSPLPLERSPKILGVYLDTTLSYHHRCNNVATRVNKRNNILKALAGTSWGQKKETLLMTTRPLEGQSVTTLHLSGASTQATPA